MQETRYGTAPTDEILKDGMVHGFERMCIVYESIVALVRHLFSIYIDVYVSVSEFNCEICKHLSILFYLAPSIINRTKTSFILNIWFVMGYKTCRKQSMELRQRWNFERWHGRWNVYSL